MKRELYEAILDNPVIIGVKNDEELEECIRIKEKRVVFVIYGNLLRIADTVGRLKDSGKIVFVHADLIEGLANREIAVDYIRQYTRSDGIISTKPAMVKRAAELGFYTALRIFLLDSMAFNNIDKQLAQCSPDIIEILPGSMPKMISKVKKKVRQPVVASGLIMDRDDIITVLDAGAFAVSSTNREIWFM